ncbi:Lipoate-protein ligase A [Thermogutta terrifontis]|uniref:Lipoate-protein ligase A n=1 Tax=Thermogutta terrifontis TaxID=1331910 RepID=A0A286RI99_9BACT|nr:Lipoate-protein ligase A [Thermogutta terrifontis]
MIGRVNFRATMERCLLLIDSPRSGPYNMAADEWCAAWAAGHEAPILRLYRWHPATLSLGYFQRYEDRKSHPSSQSCPVVRRPSGGGAILHDREWTYALCLPAEHPLAKDRLLLYLTVHETLARWLQRWGVTAVVLRRENPPARCGQTPSRPCPFLCFQRRTVGDVVAVVDEETFSSCQSSGNQPTETNGSPGTAEPSPSCAESTVKLVGSAQRRTRNAVLQHGSILLGRSPWAPELPGVWEVTGHKDPIGHDSELFRDFAVAWPPLLAQALGWRLQHFPYSTERDSLFEELLARFSSQEWTCKSQSAIG